MMLPGRYMELNFNVFAINFSLLGELNQEWGQHFLNSIVEPTSTRIKRCLLCVQSTRSEFSLENNFGFS